MKGADPNVAIAFLARLQDALAREQASVRRSIELARSGRIDPRTAYYLERMGEDPITAELPEIELAFAGVGPTSTRTRR